MPDAEFKEIPATAFRPEFVKYDLETKYTWKEFSVSADTKQYHHLKSPLSKA